MALVSVVIPNYNNARYVGRAVYSCLRQAGPKEIVIVDDASTDDSKQVIQKLSESHSEVRCLRLEKNSGVARARNIGAAEAKGDYLCFLDADDDLLSGYFEESTKALIANSHLTAIKVGMQFVDETYNPVLLPGDPRYLALIGSSACNIFMRAKTFKYLGGFSEDLRFRGRLGGEDVAFSRALGQFMQPVGYLPEAFYRVHDRKGSHLQKFLTNTRVVDANVFEFIDISDDQKETGALGIAIDEYLKSVEERVKRLGAGLEEKPSV